MLYFPHSLSQMALAMDSFKSSDNRLVNFFKSSRDKWKQKAIDRHKEIRALEVKVRDLQISRENWKNKSKETIAIGEKKVKNCVK